MTIDENRYTYDMLAKRVNARNELDDPEYTPQQIYQLIVFHYNSDKIIIKMPKDMNDKDGVEEIDTNDKNRISITRDCKYICLLFSVYFAILTIIY